MKKIISIDELRVGYVVLENIKTNDGKDLVTKGSVLTENLIRRLRQWHSKGNCMISVDDGKLGTQEELKEKVAKSLDNIAKAKGVELERAIDSLRPFISCMYEDAKCVEDLPDDAVKIRYSKDQSGHYFRVAKMAMALANLYNNELATGGKNLSLNSIGMAALLHDYGKRFKNDEASLKTLKLDREMTRKLNIRASVLTDSYDEELHSLYSYVSLKGKLSDDIREIILYHKFVKPKYGNTDNSVVKSAGILTICDIYDTLLEHVVEEEMLSPFENVISYMSQLAHNNVIDNELYSLFLEHIPIYPNGSKVLLSNGEYAVVVKRSKTFPTKPLVLVLPPSRVGLIDLSETTNVVIRKIVRSEEVTAAKLDSIQEEQLSTLLKADQEELVQTEVDGHYTLVLQNNPTDKAKFKK